MNCPCDHDCYACEPDALDVAKTAEVMIADEDHWCGCGMVLLDGGEYTCVGCGGAA